MTMHIQWPEYEIDARTFQRGLGELANTIALKVQREGHKVLPKPVFVIVDIYVMIRQALDTYDLFFFLNADERRKTDGSWRVGYSAAALPLIRCMIDCLYNITAILKNPGPKGYQFRESGYKKMLEALDADEMQYGGDPKWDAYIADCRAALKLDMGSNGLTEDEVRAARTWPTLGRYIRGDEKEPLTEHQLFLKKLTYGIWQEYSAMAHLAFEGLMPTAIFHMPGDIPHGARSQFDSVISEKMISLHIFRAAAVLLAMLTEVQAYFRFDGARIDQRMHEIWKALLPVFGVKELYEGRYAQLLKDKGMMPEVGQT
jgi:hypothetical protein